ncbi:SDR family oxidoreductase [Actinoplanes sp. CA-030573]|uniref:SDR family oxidoreductase n=1 Tax=Actinoplanes sp. CA-030573 TaxID=3239898 RepID=UPI003D91DD38
MSGHAADGGRSGRDRHLGIFGAQPALEISGHERRRCFEVNVLAAERLTRAYPPGMRDRGCGRVMRRFRPQSLLRRLIEPEEIASMVVYPASPPASATTGGAARVDGGYVDAILP